MDYSLLVGIHDAEAGNDVDDVLEGIDSNEDSEPESPREADSPQESDSPGEAEMPLSDTPPTTPPANFNGARERNISFGSNELDEREDDDDTEGFQSVDGRFLLVNNKLLVGINSDSLTGFLSRMGVLWTSTFKVSLLKNNIKQIGNSSTGFELKTVNIICCIHLSLFSVKHEFRKLFFVT